MKQQKQKNTTTPATFDIEAEMGGKFIDITAGLRQLAKHTAEVRERHKKMKERIIALKDALMPGLSKTLETAANSDYYSKQMLAITNSLENLYYPRQAAAAAAAIAKVIGTLKPLEFNIPSACFMAIRAGLPPRCFAEVANAAFAPLRKQYIWVEDDFPLSLGFHVLLMFLQSFEDETAQPSEQAQRITDDTLVMCARALNVPSAEDNMAKLAVACAWVFVQFALQSTSMTPYSAYGYVALQQSHRLGVLPPDGYDCLSLVNKYGEDAADFISKATQTPQSIQSFYDLCVDSSTLAPHRDALKPQLLEAKAEPVAVLEVKTTEEVREGNAREGEPQNWRERVVKQYIQECAKIIKPYDRIRKWKLPYDILIEKELIDPLTPAKDFAKMVEKYTGIPFETVRGSGFKDGYRPGQCVIDEFYELFDKVCEQVHATASIG